jgi:hypothetical protein
MVKLKLPLVLMLNLTFLVSFCQESSRERSQLLRCDTISNGKLNKLVKLQLKNIKAKDTFSTQELLELIRVNMSLVLKSESKLKITDKQFMYLYWKRVIPIACSDTSIDYVALKGMVCYSRKYDLYISAPIKKSDIPCYNYYYIKN